ncbi:MAG: M24 family metallopeptidase [Oscillospiraceae bacterium]|jgi:Xaa-Pro aminopeptidase
MSFYNMQETNNRLANVKKILKKNNLDAAVVYFDQVNVADGWYLTGWCGQFEKGAVLVLADSDPLLLGGPECEPFAKMCSAISDVRCFKPFMVPEEEYPNATIITFEDLFHELAGRGIHLKRVGIVGTSYFPYDTYRLIEQGFKGVELVDITDEYDYLRYFKSPWEVENIRTAFGLTYGALLEMEKKVRPGATEIEVAAAGEFYCRSRNATNFAFDTMVGAGPKSNAVAPTAGNMQMQAGEMVLLGIAPRFNGYAGVMGDTLPISGEYTQAQKDVLNVIREVFRKTRDALKPGECGKTLDPIGAKIFAKHDWTRYIVCPFVHGLGLMEAERPFFGPNGTDVLQPGSIVSIDISFFGHPVHHGVRIETGYLITETGYEPLSPEMDARLSAEL